MSSSNMSLSADRIRYVRHRAGLSQERLASKIGVHRSAVSHWERNGGGLPSTKHFYQIAKVTGVSVEWLFFGRRTALDPDTNDASTTLAFGADQPVQVAHQSIVDQLEDRLLRAFRQHGSREQMLMLSFFEGFLRRTTE